MKPFLSRYSGSISGAAYGLLMRFAFGISLGISFTDLFSVTFIWIVPIIIGITPMLFASRRQLDSLTYRLCTPIISVLLFFLCCFLMGKEDIICLIIISIPFLIGAGIGGMLFAEIVKAYKEKKGILYSILIIPVLSGVAEPHIPIPTETYEISNHAIIKATPAEIWEHVIRVKQMRPGEYPKGLFNYAGIPLPIYAELDRDTIGATRTGHFEGGLIFKETVTNWMRDSSVSFDIKVIPSTIRQTIFDQHILKGSHFKFLNAAYNLKQLDDRNTMLTLSSSYQLDTHINFYGSFWANKLLSDFQERLLVVIKNRCEIL